MQSGQSSRTAEYMALFRALESVRPPPERVVRDPFAFGFLSPRLKMVVRLARVPALGAWIRASIDGKWPGARTSGVARTRFIDGTVEAALRADIRQVVILGAGFDARPYRIPEMSHAIVFEVDHPATSAAKRRGVGRALGTPPGHVRFVSVDFGSDSLDVEMGAAGYDRTLPTLFVWEGVTNYLTEAAVSDTLRWCAQAASAEVVFTYVDRQVLESPRAFEGTDKLFATLSAASERWTFGLDPLRLRGFLAERGLTLESDLGAAEYRALCYGPSASGMRGYEFYRVAVARVAAPPP